MTIYLWWYCTGSELHCTVVHMCNGKALPLSQLVDIQRESAAGHSGRSLRVHACLCKLTLCPHPKSQPSCGKSVPLLFVPITRSPAQAGTLHAPPPRATIARALHRPPLPPPRLAVCIPARLSRSCVAAPAASFSPPAARPHRGDPAPLRRCCRRVCRSFRDCFQAIDFISAPIFVR